VDVEGEEEEEEEEEEADSQFDDFSTCIARV